MKAQRTGRGFMRIEFKDRYESECSIQKSSLATDDAIWFGVDKDFEGRACTRMHLTRDMVIALLPILQQFADTGDIPSNIHAIVWPTD